MPQGNYFVIYLHSFQNYIYDLYEFNIILLVIQPIIRIITILLHTFLNYSLDRVHAGRRSLSSGLMNILKVEIQEMLQIIKTIKLFVTYVT